MWKLTFVGKKLSERIPTINDRLESCFLSNHIDKLGIEYEWRSRQDYTA